MATETERCCASAALIDQPIADAQLNRSPFTETSALMCCLCRSSVVSNPVQLACLHNCCQSCAAKAAAEAEASDEPLSAVVSTGSDRNCVRTQLPPSLPCPLCSCGTPLDALVSNSFVAIKAQAARIRSASTTHCDGCAIFCSDGSPPALLAEAEWWCAACASFFCGSCSRLHARFSSEHEATSLTALRAAGLAVEEAERAAATSAARRCDAHGQPYDLLCLTCALPLCRLCPAACADRAHRLAPLDDRLAAEERVVRALDELRRRLGEFRARAEAVAAEEAVQERATKAADVARQRAECERQIDFNWATVESAVEGTFEAARRDLLRKFQAAEEENQSAMLSTASAGRFDATGALAALAYATCLADCGDVASVLLQEERVLTALRELTRKADQLIEAALVRESRRTSVVTAITDGRRSDLPENLSELARSWIGEPNCAVLGRLHYDNDVAQGLSAKGHWPELKHGADEGRSSWLALDCGDLDYRVLRFDGCVTPAAKGASNDPSSSCSPAVTSVATPAAAAAAAATAASTRSMNFRTSADCFDVALIPDGRLLLAARDKGLIECAGDGSGTVLSTWRPRNPTDNYDCVTSVAISTAVFRSLGSGDRVLVVAGLLRSRCVALLIAPPPPSQRPKQLSNRGGQLNGSDRWTEARRVGWPGSRPWHLAVHGDLMAVTDAINSSRTGTVVTGPQLTLVALSRSRVLLRKQLDYPAFGVAVTAAAVIAAANEPAASGLGIGPRRYPIDCFNHSGELLWRCSLGERALSIVTPRLLSSSSADAPPATAAVLYVALADVGKVIAISATDGSQLVDVFVGDGNKSSSPLRMSLAEISGSGGDGGPRRIVLASLANDNRTVTLRTSVGVL